ncbi:type VI secretion system tube protein Hcp [Pseudomonas sp. P66]|uniref:Type VI secretion system tube protein Hcp n=1 Tax=Pseudomonas arcuscaelestis TaxID=2710591 RepID=A0ABS2C4Q1_9PSED|nr:type VI secretion system tube protein TssD [Pseudomonas arcuscaelestis]MBM3114148.1 type VI secretion system tube protein Hcp [Pseudomonas arcuscaelestis]MBM5460690.1 type VI secretion system tube protein Hcp [Pseudomonas arcuscaelestis]
MASHGYITITGKTQGLISAGCSSQESIGNKCQAGHADEIMVLAMNHGMTNVGNIKRTTHGPIVITKNIDKSSPLLAQALTNREAIDCTICFYRTSAFGTQEEFYTIKLGGAQVADYYVRSFKVAGGVSLTIEGMANLQSVDQIREELIK